MSMTNQIAATEGALRVGAEAVNSARQDVAATVSRVDRELDDLRAAWAGAAATSYAELLQSWQRNATRLQRSLDEFEHALRATERDQIATEELHSKTIAGLSGMMTGS